MFRFYGGRLLFVAALGVFFAGAALAQTKVAVVNLQQAILDTAEIKKAQADLEAKYKPIQDQMAKLQKEIQDIRNKLDTLAGKLTPEAQTDLTVEGQRKQRELQRQAEDLQADVNRERNEILSKSGRQMQEIVKKIAEEQGFDVVIDVGNTVYFKPALEITKQATEAYDKAHPVS
jgi:outer membrane protein